MTCSERGSSRSSTSSTSWHSSLLRIDWEWIDGEIRAALQRQGTARDRDALCERWVYDPYFPALHRGKSFSSTSSPHERSDLSHWRKRLGDKLELLLAEKPAGGARQRRAADPDLARVTVDTTVQPRTRLPDRCQAAAHARRSRAQPPGAEAPGPTAAILHPYRQTRRDGGGALRPSNSSIATVGSLRVLRTRLGRLIRDIRRKIAGRQDIEAAFEAPLSRASQLRSQQQRQRGWKLYSFHTLRPSASARARPARPMSSG